MWISCTYHGTVMECGLPVTVHELLLWLSSFVTDYWNVVCCLPVTVYMSWGCSTQPAQFKFMDKMATKSMKISCLMVNIQQCYYNMYVTQL